MKLILVHETSNRPALIGETLETFRGEKAVLQGFHLPYDAELLDEGYAMTLNLHRGAKIYCQVPGGKYQEQWYPSVCGLKFIIAA